MSDPHPSKVHSVLIGDATRAWRASHAINQDLRSLRDSMAEALFQKRLRGELARIATRHLNFLKLTSRI